VGYQPKQDNRGWFDEVCKTAIYGKNTTHKKWIGRPTRSKRLENESLHKILHTICKKKKERERERERKETDNRVKNLEHNTDENNMRNAYKET
jgi:hypothetical protein